VRRGEIKIAGTIYNNRGSASIFVLVSCVFLLFVFFLVFDIARLYAIKISARHGLNLALRAAAAEIDMDALADPDNPKLRIMPDQAEASFYRILRANLRLDEDNAPLMGSIADGSVEVCFFRVVNEEDIPFAYTYDGYSEVISKVAVTAIIKVPVKMGSFARAAGASEYSYLYVHSTVGPELVPQEE
jgi:hypothetical protein